MRLVVHCASGSRCRLRVGVLAPFDSKVVSLEREVSMIFSLVTVREAMAGGYGRRLMEEAKQSQ